MFFSHSSAKDGMKLDLCHAPIPPQQVSNTLCRNGLMANGNFLIRESRNSDRAFTLSICYQQKVMNYRIIRTEEGYSFQDPQTSGEDQEAPRLQVFPTLEALVDHHKKILVRWDARVGPTGVGVEID